MHERRPLRYVDEVVPVTDEQFDRLREKPPARSRRLQEEAESREASRNPDRRRFGGNTGRLADELAEQLQVEGDVRRMEARAARRASRKARRGR